jgi:PP-loop superfamily ATP-utilizing enzyme
MIMPAEPPERKEGFASDTSMEAVGRRLLNSIGIVEPTDSQIEQAIEANDEFIEQLEAIRDRAMQLDGNGYDAPEAA